VADNYAAPIANTQITFDSKDKGSGVQRPRTLGLFYALANSQAITRPADTTAYAANDLVANNTTAGSVVYTAITIAWESAAPVMIPRLRLFSNHTTGLAGVAFNVRLWSSAPAYTNGDNGAYAITTGAANHVAKFQGTFEQFTDGAFAECALLAGDFLTHVPSSTTIVWDLQTLTAFTPQSGKTFTLFIEALQGGIG
jgi:hypothetical protein